MKVFQDFISKLDNTKKHESNFGNLCMKKGDLFQKGRFSFLSKFSMGGVDPGNATAVNPICIATLKMDTTVTEFCLLIVTIC